MFEGRDISTMNRRERLAMRNGFQLLLQDPYNCLPRICPSAARSALGLEVHGVGRKEIASRVRDVMREVGLSAGRSAFAARGMSAGQRQACEHRARLVLEPRLMILDETLSALRPCGTVAPPGPFRAIAVKHGLIYLFISHDLAMVRRACTRIGVMYLGKMVEVADTHEPSTIPTSLYRRYCPRCRRWTPIPTSRRNASSTGSRRGPIDIPPGCSFASRCPMPLCAAGSRRLCCLSINRGGSRPVTCSIEKRLPWRHEPRRHSAVTMRQSIS